jgi:hypothetical protein
LQTLLATIWNEFGCAPQVSSGNPCNPLPLTRRKTTARNKRVNDFKKGFAGDVTTVIRVQLPATAQQTIRRCFGLTARLRKKKREVAGDASTVVRVQLPSRLFGACFSRALRFVTSPWTSDECVYASIILKLLQLDIEKRSNESFPAQVLPFSAPGAQLLRKQKSQREADQERNGRIR